MKVLISSELSQELTKFFEANPGLIMKAFSEFLKQNPEIMQEELQRMSESLEYTQIEQAKDRKRLRNLEMLLGLIENEEMEDFEENKEELNEIFSKSVLAKFKPVKKDVTEKDMLKLLYEELEKVPSMRNKDVINFLKLSKTNTLKATRLMRLMPEIYNDVVCEPVPGLKRILRIYRKI